MKKNIKDLILERINEAKEEGFQGVEIDLCYRAYDVTSEVINEIAADGYDVIYADYNQDETPLLLISW